MRLIDDQWTTEPVERSQKASDQDLSDKAATLFDVIKTTLNRYGCPQKTEESGKEHIGVETESSPKAPLGRGLVF